MRCESEDGQLLVGLGLARRVLPDGASEVDELDAVLLVDDDVLVLDVAVVDAERREVVDRLD